jgi:hypothetical protein
MNDMLELLYAGGYSEEVNVVVQFDSYSLFEGIKRYEIQLSEENKPELVNIQSLSEGNMGKKETLVDFVEWAIGRHSASKYCLVLSDHGVGWRNGFLTDKTTGDPGVDVDYMSMGELKNALSEIKGKLGGKEIDLLVFDACQMAMAEVFYQIRGSVKICVGISDMVPACPYHCSLPDLNQDPDCDAITLAEYFVDGYDQCYIQDYKVEVYDIEYLWNTVKGKLDEFSKTLINKFSDYEEEIVNAIADTESYNGLDGYITHYKNLDTFALRIRNSIDDEELSQKAQDLIDALWECKLYSTGYPELSIYLPTKNWKYKYDPSYSKLDLCRDTNWNEFTDITRNIRSKNFVNSPLIKNILFDFFNLLKLT